MPLNPCPISQFCHVEIILLVWPFFFFMCPTILVFLDKSIYIISLLSHRIRRFSYITRTFPEPYVTFQLVHQHLHYHDFFFSSHPKWVFYVLVGHLYIFVGEIPVQALCPFFSVVFLLLSLKSFLYILDTRLI